ncbi:MAG TPA: hypothetical protein VJK26_02370 [Patescibacteria group bacterium]|nr:hypothetical protein [Patescibacteria group bacterium]
MNSKEVTNKQIIVKRARKKRIKRRFRLGDNEKEIIKLIGIGTVVISSLALPNLPIILKPFLNSRPNGVWELIKKLNQKKIINLGGEKVKLTTRGRQLLQKIKMGEIEISRPKKWDGVWHLVSYDIPNNLNKERDYFRSVLKRWQFYQIQKSLWVYPFECKEEIAALAEYLKVASYVVIMTTDLLANEDEVKEIFNL